MLLIDENVPSADIKARCKYEDFTGRTCLHINGKYPCPKVHGAQPLFPRDRMARMRIEHDVRWATKDDKWWHKQYLCSRREW